MSDAMINVLYFAWMREHTGTTSEQITLPDGAKTVGDLMPLLMARSAGHETLISLPMEPLNFPASDPGPFALQTNLSSSENINRLHFLLSVSMGNVGLLKMMGSNFVASEQALMPILKEIKNRTL